MDTTDNQPEHRIYILLRGDLEFHSSDLAVCSGVAAWRVWRAAAAQGHPGADAYDPYSQPKIAVRAKNLNAFLRAVREAEDAGLPVSVVSVGGERLSAGIGPVTRDNLPPFVRGLRALGDSARPGVGSAPRMEAGPGCRLMLYVRRDVRMPDGKLAAQAGHGVCSAAFEMMSRNPDGVLEWEEAGCPVEVVGVPDLTALETVVRNAQTAGLPAAMIVDAGRTFFSAPTETVVGVGPCLPSRFIPELTASPG